MKLFRSLTIGFLSSKPVIITGCDSGFGFDLCKRLDILGIPVIATVLESSNVGRLTEILSNKCLVLQLDVCKHDNILLFREKVVEFLSQSGLKLWGLVNNAGITTAIGPSDWLTLADFQRHLDVNTLGQIDMCLTFLPLLKQSKGRIVNMVSVMGRFSIPFAAPYAVSKFAARAFTECLRREMKPFEVSIHMIEPGYHRTPITNPEVHRQHLSRAYDNFEHRAEYGEQFKEEMLEFTKVNLEMFSAHSTKGVVDAYVAALFSRFPKSRYLVGWDAFLLFGPVSLLPDYITDFVISLFRMPKPASCK